MKSPLDVLIIGAGISGLTLGYKLKRKGVEFALLEAAERPGGWVRTAYSDWGQLELGPRGIRLRGDSGRAFIELVRELSLESRLVGSTETASERYILYHDKLEKVDSAFWRWPFSKVTQGLCSALLQEALGIRTLRNFLNNIAKKQPYLPLEDMSVEDFLCERFGSSLYKRLFEPALVGVFGTGGETLSVATCLTPLWEAYRSSGSIVRGMMFKALRQLFKGRDPSMKPWNKYSLVNFDKGLQVLIDALYSQVQGQIHSKQKVSKIQWDQRLSAFRIQSNSQVWLAKKVIVACSPWSLDHAAIDLLNWDPLMSHVEPHSLALVHLGINKPLKNEWGFGYLVPPKQGQDFLGAVMDSNIFPQHDLGNIHRITLMLNKPSSLESFDKLAQRSIEKLKHHLNENLCVQFIRHSVAERAVALYRPGFQEIKKNLLLEIEEKQLPIHFLGVGYGAFSVAQCIVDAKRLVDKI